ncbi:hypothetical protein Gotri_011337 [Gossypium trilobum]|uniref:RNase H type-1 domain-containing protein n=1 Tax=Gossypium trilobum TaxID=34281 RepID=A0A7J9ETE6_9ROSI|nr:hypothetical protein [Gossypium trilobum]
MVSVGIWKMGEAWIYGMTIGGSKEFKKDYLRCGACNETLIYALKECLSAREILVLGGLNNNLLDGLESRFLDSSFRGKEEEARVGWERATTLNQDFWIHHLVYNPLLPVSMIEKCWIKPPRDIVTINFDVVSSEKLGFGMIARNLDGFVLGGGGVTDIDMKGDWAELKTLKESIKFAKAFNFHKVHFETDSVSLVNHINKRGHDITLLGYYTEVMCEQLE